ncbi:MAG: V-type ATP synthase subunit F [Deltaproteobacteria bacterium]|nr:V-type ATP synthase subunit F [Deltaproteobacteria bacterium]
MGDIAVIGDSNTVLAFQLGGVEGYVVSTAEDARRAFQEVYEGARGGKDEPGATKLLLVTQQVIDAAGDLLDAGRSDTSAPMVLEIPGFGEHVEQRPLQRLLVRVLRTGR